MTQTSFAVNDALTQKKWASTLGYDVVYRTELSPMIGTDGNSIIHLKTQTSKEAGDSITFPLMKKLTGDGFTENEVAEGNGENLSLYSDSVVINELGHVVNIPNSGRSIDSQRVAIPLRTAAKAGLSTWKKERMSTVFFNHVCGNTVVTDSKYTANNAILTPTRHIFVDTTGPTVNSADESIAAADTFDLNYVDYAREKAISGDSPLRPINVKGDIARGGQDISGAKFVMYLHPYQVTDLRTNTGTGQWLDIQKAALQGGEISKNAIYSDALGEYNNVILKVSNHVTTGVNSSTGAAISTVRRAVLLGAQSVALAYGKGSSGTTYNWNEELFDHKRRMEVSAFCIYGMTKCQFDSQDFGTIVVSSYANAHTS